MSDVSSYPDFTALPKQCIACYTENLLKKQCNAVLKLSPLASAALSLAKQQQKTHHQAHTSLGNTNHAIPTVLKQKKTTCLASCAPVVQCRCCLKS